MRITFALAGGFDRSGGVRSIAQIAHGLIRRGHEVLAVSPPLPPPSARRRVRALLRGEGWLPAQDPRQSHLHELTVPTRLLDTRRPIEDRDLPPADIVVATWWETAPWIARLAPDKGAPLHFLQDYEIWADSQEIVDAALRLPIPKAVIAGWLGDLLRDRFGQEPLALCPLGVDCRYFHPAARRKQTTPTVGFMYSPVPIKGIDIAIGAVQRARRQLPSLRVVVCGNAPPSAGLPLPPDVRYERGASDHRLREIYQQCDAWLFPSRREGFGLPAVEAMASGTPLLACPAGAAPELLSTGGGWLLPPEDPEALSQAILRLCRLPEADWRLISGQGIQSAARFDWENSVQCFEKAIQALAAGR